MEKVDLDVMSTLSEGISVGAKNLASLIAAAVLYLLTIWIPYLNVGTTIAMCSIPGRIARGEIISPLFIFDSEYRKDFASFFLLVMFVAIAMYFGLIFLFVPGIVVAISTSLSVYILIDNDTNPIDAIKQSVKATYGNKLAIFCINILYAVAVFVVGIIIFLIGYNISETLLSILMVALIVSVAPFSYGIDSVIYKKLVLDRANEEVISEVEEIISETEKIQ